MIKKYLQKRSCPCCNGKKFSKKTIHSPLDGATVNFNTLEKSWNGFFKEKVIFSYARCLDCGLLYCPNFFTETALNKLYSQMLPNMEEVPISALVKTQYGYFKTLKKHSNLTGNMLEIGPDIGLFTQHCVNEGKFSKYWLFEPNVLVENHLRRVVNDKPSFIHNKMFDFKVIPDNSINTVVAIHVMDHLLDPVRLLKDLKKKLTKNSRLLIVTHDESSLIRRLFGWRWPAFCLQHPQIYNNKSLENLLQKSGFYLIEQRKTTNYFKISFLLKHFLWACGLKFKKVPDFFGWTVGLKLGNIITIACQSEDNDDKKN